MAPRRTILLLLFLVTIALVVWRVRQPALPPLAAKDESCLTCHAGMTGLSAFHDPKTFGCASCHAGNPRDTTKEGAHRGMMLVPGNLSNADRACGGCHQDLVHRVKTSMMATARGIVGVDRWVFGEQPTPDGTNGLQDLGRSHADEHMRQLCYPCHLANDKKAPAPINETSRGGGCLACHISYTGPRGPDRHPNLTLNVSDDHCFGCHSRSGRISLNYQGWHETLRTRPESKDERLLADGRVLLRQTPDVHHTAGLACIDCHTSRETMGDGQVYTHQEQATEVRCETCHVEGRPRTVSWDSLDQDARKVILVRFGRPLSDKRFLRIQKTGMALTNAWLDSTGVPVLQGKLSGRTHPLRSPVAACRQPGHDRVSCQSCHTAWVPQCVGCHTQLDRKGQWQEFASDFLAAPPTLGVRERNNRIEPYAPGMIMTLNKNRRDVAAGSEMLAPEGTFHRLFAPAVPHTTVRQARTCRSCHNDPVALGYGRGQLVFAREGKRFTPAYQSLRDGLPADAWLPFRGERSKPHSTRLDTRPFNRAEQDRILRAGACLTCHDPTKDAALYADFKRSLTRMTPACFP